VPAADESDALYRVAYDEAVRALAEQQALIESLRARAGLLLSAAAIATSFLGSQALTRVRLGPLGWIGLACFFAATATALAILWPRELILTADPEAVIRIYVEAGEPTSIGTLYRDLSLHFRRGLEENRLTLDRLSTLLQIGSALLAIEILLWVATLALQL
jgi:hypothetical protein